METEFPNQDPLKEKVLDYIKTELYERNISGGYNTTSLVKYKIIDLFINNIPILEGDIE